MSSGQVGDLGVGDDPVDFEEGASTRVDANRYLAQSLGVFGQAYLSQMVELGLFSIGANHGIPVRSARGLVLANAFAASIGSELEALLTSPLNAATVTRAELEELVTILPSSIGVGDERHLYEALLFANREDASIAEQC